jgi:predicted transcriptional regulator
MKIRMQGNSIRLRLSQGEVHLLGETGRVEESVRFGPNPDNTLTCALESGSVPTLHATFSQGLITVHVPSEKIREWVSTDLVGMEDTMAVREGLSLRILIEKDFRCLSERGEDESDNFPNPNQTC